MMYVFELVAAGMDLSVLVVSPGIMQKLGSAARELEVGASRDAW